MVFTDNHNVLSMKNITEVHLPKLEILLSARQFYVLNKILSFQVLFNFFEFVSIGKSVYLCKQRPMETYY